MNILKAKKKAGIGGKIWIPYYDRVYFINEQGKLHTAYMGSLDTLLTQDEVFSNRWEAEPADTGELVLAEDITLGRGR